MEPITAFFIEAQDGVRAKRGLVQQPYNDSPGKLIHLRDLLTGSFA